jgi:hypothetical protein
VKKAHVGVVFILLALGSAAVAQTTKTATTMMYQGSDLSLHGFTSCSGDPITLSGSFTETTTQWIDADGNTHTLTQIDSSSLSAASADISYTVIFSQKLVETVTDDGLTVAQTATFRLKLQGAGPLNNQMFFSEMHVTFPQGIGSGPYNNKSWSKCTG